MVESFLYLGTVMKSVSQRTGDGCQWTVFGNMTTELRIGNVFLRMSFVPGDAGVDFFVFTPLCSLAAAVQSSQ